MKESPPHQSVLVQECIAAFEGLPIKCLVDATLGAGGHSAALLSVHPEIERLIGIDQDPEALKIAEKRLKGAELSLVLHNFSDLSHILKGFSLLQVDAILADLGVSSMQLDQSERGFSFMRDGPLDMRMDQKQALTAAEIVNSWEERVLADIFFHYGEEIESKRAARAICQDRQQQPFHTTGELAGLLERVLKRGKRDIHPATKIFQALRIAVNGELEHLERFLPQALQALRPGGRLAVISFHSLEDRLVKRRFAYYASDKESTSGLGGLFVTKEPSAKILTRKPIVASEEEIARNPRSRSAKLRVIEKL